MLRRESSFLNESFLVGNYSSMIELGWYRLHWSRFFIFFFWSPIEVCIPTEQLCFLKHTEKKLDKETAYYQQDPRAQDCVGIYTYIHVYVYSCIHCTCTRFSRRMFLQTSRTTGQIPQTAYTGATLLTWTGASPRSAFMCFFQMTLKGCFPLH